MPPKFAIGDRVRCLASRFNEETPDINGLFFADRYRADGNGEWCFEIAKHVYSCRGRNPQKYRIHYDGDALQLQSTEEHLEPEGEEGNEASDGEEDDAEEEGTVDVDNTRGDSDDDDAEWNDGGTGVEIGQTVEVHGKVWKRVDSMGVDVRVEENQVVEPPAFELKNLEVTDDTSELDLLELCLPVTVYEMLDVVKFRAGEVNCKYGDK